MDTEIRRKDLQKCIICGNGVMHTGLPLFWRVKIEGCKVDVREVEKLHGLETYLGSPALANVMGSDAPLANAVPEEWFFVCAQCAFTEERPIIGFAHLASDEQETLEVKK